MSCLNHILILFAGHCPVSGWSCPVSRLSENMITCVNIKNCGLFVSGHWFLIEISNLYKTFWNVWEITVSCSVEAMGLDGTMMGLSKWLECQWNVTRHCMSEHTVFIQLQISKYLQRIFGVSSSFIQHLIKNEKPNRNIDMFNFCVLFMEADLAYVEINQSSPTCIYSTQLYTVRQIKPMLPEHS